MKTGSSPEQQIKDDIRREYAKTYPNCIFSLTNHITRLKRAIAIKDGAIKQHLDWGPKTGSDCCLLDADLRDALTSEPIGRALTCEWRQGNLWDTPDVWDTECGEMFYFGDGKPCEDGIDYCCYCGKKIVRIDVKPDEDL